MRQTSAATQSGSIALITVLVAGILFCNVPNSQTQILTRPQEAAIERDRIASEAARTAKQEAGLAAITKALEDHAVEQGKQQIPEHLAILDARQQLVLARVDRIEVVGWGLVSLMIAQLFGAFIALVISGRKLETVHTAVNGGLASTKAELTLATREISLLEDELKQARQRTRDTRVGDRMGDRSAFGQGDRAGDQISREIDDGEPVS